MIFEIFEIIATIKMIKIFITSKSFLMLLLNFHTHSYLKTATELLSDPIDNLTSSRLLYKRNYAIRYSFY